MEIVVTEIKSPARDATWDIARGIGMALVIYGHFIEPIYPAREDIGRAFNELAFSQWQVIYSFHMMLFFLVSGAVNKKLPKKEWPDVLRGSLRLLALAWVVHLLGVIVDFSTGNMPATPWEAMSTAFTPIIEGTSWSVGVLWFLTSLCFVQLLAYFLLRHLSAIAVIVGAMAATAAVVYFDASNYYLFRTWMPGLSFFALGYLFAQLQIRWLVWPCIFLFAAVILLVPLNSGCAYTINSTCDQFEDGPFGVRMFGGSYGCLPWFFVTAFVGSIAVVCLSAGLARYKSSAVLAYMGKNSLDLFIINGFFIAFLSSYVGRIDWSHFNAIYLAAIGIGLIAVHLLLQRILRRVLGGIDAVALRIADVITALISRRTTA